MATLGAVPSQLALSGAVVVVTGASGQLGAAYTEWLMKSGARVVGIDSQSARVGTNASSYLHAVADIRERDQLEHVLAECESRWGTPTGLINNAAIDAPPRASGESVGPFETFPIAIFRDVLDVNVMGTVVRARSLAARWRGQAEVQLSMFHLSTVLLLQTSGFMNIAAGQESHFLSQLPTPFQSRPSSTSRGTYQRIGRSEE